PVSLDFDPGRKRCRCSRRSIGRWNYCRRSSRGPYHNPRWSCCWIRRWPERRPHFGGSDNPAWNPDSMSNYCNCNPGCNCKLTLKATSPRSNQLLVSYYRLSSLFTFAVTREDVSYP